MSEPTKSYLIQVSPALRRTMLKYSSIWLLLLSVLAILILMGPRLPIKLDTDEFRKSGDYAWQADVSIYGNFGIGITNANLVVREDGKPLPFPHSAHNAIRKSGKGRYSHWKSYVLFSTVDNSDPNTNGKNYELVYYKDLLPNGLFRYIGISIALVIGFITFLQVERTRSHLAISIGALALAGALITPLLEPYHIDYYTGSYRSKDTIFDHSKSSKSFDKLRFANIRKERDESAETFLKRVSDVVYDGSFHCDFDSFRLNLLSHASLLIRGLPDEVFYTYGILDRQNFECGFCHQRAYVASSILKENGLDAVPYALNGHVVTKVNSSKRAFFIDPDHRVPVIEATDDGDLKNRLKTAYKYTEDLYGAAYADKIIDFFLTTDDNRDYDVAPLDQAKNHQVNVFTDARFFAVSLFIILMSGFFLVGSLIARLSRA